MGYLRAATRRKRFAHTTHWEKRASASIPQKRAGDRSLKRRSAARERGSFASSALPGARAKLISDGRSMRNCLAGQRSPCATPARPPAAPRKTGRTDTSADAWRCPTARCLAPAYARSEAQEFARLQPEPSAQRLRRWRWSARPWPEPTIMRGSATDAFQPYGKAIYGLLTERLGKSTAKIRQCGKILRLCQNCHKCLFATGKVDDGSARRPAR